MRLAFIVSLALLVAPGANAEDVPFDRAWNVLTSEPCRKALQYEIYLTSDRYTDLERQMVGELVRAAMAGFYWGTTEHRDLTRGDLMNKCQEYSSLPFIELLKAITAGGVDQGSSAD